MIENIFQICCDVIRVFSSFFGTSYEEMNTILFIYLQPSLLLASFVIVVGIISFKLLKELSIFKLFLLVLFGAGGLIYATATIVIWKRYSLLSMHDTCVLAYDDLETLGEISGMGYIGVNLFLFIIFFHLIFGFNTMSAIFINKYLK